MLSKKAGREIVKKACWTLAMAGVVRTFSSRVMLKDANNANNAHNDH